MVVVAVVARTFANPRKWRFNTYLSSVSVGHKFGHVRGCELGLFAGKGAINATQQIVEVLADEFPLKESDNGFVVAGEAQQPRVIRCGREQGTIVRHERIET